MRSFGLNGGVPNAVGTIGLILAIIVVVILIRRGAAWYLAILLGFGTVTAFSGLALLIALSSRKRNP